MLLSEKELENLDSSAKKRKGGSIVCIEHDVYHNENVSMHSVSDTNEAQNDNVLNVHCVNLGANVEPDSSTAGSHEFLRLELPGAWEPPVSSSIARSCAMLGSQNSLPLGD